MIAASTSHVGSNRTARTESPVFLLGCHRSGTTLVRYLLDAHPALACPPESKFMAGLHAFYTYSQSLKGLETMGCPPEVVLAAIRRLACEMFATYTTRQGKRRWVDKTPNYFRILDFIDRVFDHQVLYVCIHRHPLDTVASLEELWRFVKYLPDDPDIAAVIEQHGRGYTAWAAYWRRVNGTLAAFCGDRPDRCLALRYEDLVVRPHVELRRILDFIGEPWVDGLIEAAFERTPTRGYQDWKIRTTGAIHARSVGRWRSWAPRDVAHVWNIARPVAGGLGYEPPTLPQSTAADASATSSPAKVAHGCDG